MQQLTIHPTTSNGLNHFYCPFSGTDLLAAFETEDFPATLALGWSAAAPELPFCDKYQRFAAEEPDFTTLEDYLAAIDNRKKDQSIPQEWYLFELAPANSPLGGESIYLCLEAP